MPDVLPQQRLLLEILVMSGDVAVNEGGGDSLLWRTIKECEEKKWLKRRTVSQGFHGISITDPGRTAVS